MPEYLAPGVYVEEVSAGPRPIQAVGTRTAAFVGKAPDSKAHLNKAVAINYWTQFLNEFTRENSQSTPLSNAVFGFFRNGGSRCFVVNVGQDNPIAGLDSLKPIDEIAIVAAPGSTDPASYDAVLTHCEELGDRVAILDVPKDADVECLTKVAVVESGEDPGERRCRPRNSAYGACYFPWITISDPLSRELVDVPPSGHIAGIWARTDATRGVHKAPANEMVRGALNLTYQLTRAELGVLNPQGVNCIRLFPSAGILVWGARTLAESSSEYRYLNVRRLVNMIEESIDEAMRWVVFEPNDQSLWKRIRRDVGAFLTMLWRDGALKGATPEEAFFVKCDEETNPPEVINEGRVVTLIGIAPVKPAEFVIFRISQWEGGTEVESEGGA